VFGDVGIVELFLQLSHLIEIQQYIAKGSAFVA
jgi:hypothetical protein